MFARWKQRAVTPHGSADTEISVKVTGEQLQPVVIVAGRVTVDSSPQLRSVLLGLLRTKGPRVVRIDMSEVSYLDTSGIATLLEALKIAGARSVMLQLTELHGQPEMLARITEFAEIFEASGSEVHFSEVR